MGTEVDPAFIQEAVHRSNPDIPTIEGIPLIDLSPIITTPATLTSGEHIQSLVHQVGSACEVWGFFQVINHGVPIQTVDKFQHKVKEFFALPLDEKKRVRRDKDNFMGYYDAEYTKNVRDWKEVFDFAAREPMLLSDTRVVHNRWPEFPLDMKDVCTEYKNAVEVLAFKILELISLSLNLPAKRLNGYFNNPVSSVRLSHCPSCPNPELALGTGRHKDQDAITVLYQDEVGGLDVRRKSDGEWVRVKPIPNSYVINVGDCIQVWSNDKYESPEHRVSVNSRKGRFSVPFFMNPSYDVMLKPVEELVTEDEPAKYNEFSWGEFYIHRKNSNFQKLGVENLQISYYKEFNFVDTFFRKCQSNTWL